MSFEITINIPALDRVADALNGLVAAANAQGIATGKPVVAETPAAKPVAAAKPKVEPKPEPVEEKPKAEPSDGAADFDAVKKAAVALSQGKGGRDALQAALTAHGATAGISTLPEANWAAFVAHCEAEMAA